MSDEACRCDPLQIAPMPNGDYLAMAMRQITLKAD